MKEANTKCIVARCTLQNAHYYVYRYELLKYGRREKDAVQFFNRHIIEYNGEQLQVHIIYCVCTDAGWRCVFILVKGKARKRR